MKSLVPLVAICAALTTLSAFSEDPPKNPSLDILRKQLITAVEEDLAKIKDGEFPNASMIKSVLDHMRMLPADSIMDKELPRLARYLDSSPTKISENTQKCLSLYSESLKAATDAQKERRYNEIVVATRGFVQRAMAADDPEVMGKVADEFRKYREKLTSEDYRDSRISSSNLSNVSEFIDYTLKFQDARLAANWSAVASNLNYLGNYTKNIESYSSAEEIKAFMEKTRASIGILPNKDNEALAQKTIHDLLDDSNQDRLEPIMEQIRKYKLIFGSSSSSSGYASLSARWQRIESFANTFQQAIQRVKDGGYPQLSLDQWVRSDSGYPILIKKEELIERLKKYRVKVSAEGASSRLYYDPSEMWKEADEMVASLLDAANQERLDVIQEKIKSHRQFCSSSSSSEFSSVSSRLLQIEYFARNLAQSVQRVQDGGASQINIDQWLQSSSDYKPLMKKSELAEFLKKYQVKVKAADGSTVEEPLYQDVRDVLRRIGKMADIEKELPVLTKSSRSSSDSSYGYLAAVLPVLSNFAELHANLQKAESFVMPTSLQSQSAWESSSYSSQQLDSEVLAQIEQLRSEAERQVMARMLPSIQIDEKEDRATMVTKLLKQFTEAKNYDAVLTLSRVTSYFYPKKPVIAAQEAHAIQNYLDGIRQQEELGEPRLATLYLQRAAAVRSSIIPIDDLKSRLQKLKLANPADYQKGTDDLLGTQTPGSPYLQAPLVVPAAR